MGRPQQIAVLVEHYQNPRHQGVLENADVAKTASEAGSESPFAGLQRLKKKP